LFAEGVSHDLGLNHATDYPFLAGATSSGLLHRNARDAATGVLPFSARHFETHFRPDSAKMFWQIGFTPREWSS
jgi:hypothetical protein